MTEKSAGSQRSIYRRTVPYIPKHPDPHDPETGEENDYSGESGLEEYLNEDNNKLLK